MDDPSLVREYVVSRVRLDGPVELVAADRRWPDHYGVVRAGIQRLLGDGALTVEHVGSTSIPGLIAKPVLDICLVVEDPSIETSFVPALESAGFLLTLREPDWHQHRLLKGDPAVNLHVFGPNRVEVDRLIRFRDLLRTHSDLRDEYARVKEELGARHWAYMQDCADAKSPIVERILAASGPI